MEIGKVNVTMTVGEIQRYKELENRDIAKPFIRERFETTDKHIDRCPVCKEALGKGNFCPNCGQRIDTENIAFS